MLQYDRWNWSAPYCSQCPRSAPQGPRGGRAEGHRWAALYRLAVNLGMREAELFGLTWQAVDFERGTLRNFQQLRRARPKRGEPRKFVLQAVKTKARERTLKLDADLIEVLRAHKRNYDEERALLGGKWRDPWGTLVFTSDTGGPIHISGLLVHFKQALKLRPRARRVEV